MTTTSVATAALAVFVLGCAAPTIGFRIPTRTLAGGEAKPHDIGTCEVAAAPGSTNRDQRYAACMIARGYVSWVDVEIWRPIPTPGGGNVQYDVATKAAVSEDRVLEDLVQCREHARHRAATSTAKTLTVVTGAGVLMQQHSIDGAFPSCMAGRGYDVSRWEPRR